MQTDIEDILKRHGALLARVAASYEANEHLRQELIQEISLAVWQALSRFRGESSLKTFILRVAHNRCVNHVTYHSRVPAQAQYDDAEGFSQAGGDQPAMADEQQRQIHQLLEAVRALPMQTRQVVTLSMEGLSYQDIASVSGLTSSNVGVILNRARKELAEKLQHV